MSSARDLHVTQWGDAGEPAVFVHGSFGWGTQTWAKQRPLSESYRLLLVDRRGFGESPAHGRVDFERDADDVAALLRDGVHVVGQSYGGVVALLASGRRPEAVRSLTVIEPPAFALARGNEAVEEVIAGVARAVDEARDASDYHARFMRAFGFDAPQEVLEGAGLSAAKSSWRERPPWEASLRLDALRGLHVLVVRGDWSVVAPQARERAGRAFHAVCDALVEALDAESAVFPSAHNPQYLGDPFNDRLRAFWEVA